MKCFRCFSFVLFALLGVFFGSFFINQNDTYAVSDVTFTFDSSTREGFVCRTGSSYPDLPDCSDYKYVFVSPSFSSGANFTNLLTYNFQISFNGLNKGIFIGDSLIDFSGYAIINRIYFSSGSSVYTDGLSSVSVTLSETNPFIFSDSPSGSITLTENGTFDVSSYAEAVVDVPPVIEQGDYHDDLVAINNSIIICAATCLVIYFFYCIYRMIIKNSGVK